MYTNHKQYYMDVRKFWNFLSCDWIIWLLTKFLITKDMSTRKKQLKHWFPFLKKPSHFLPFLQCVLIFIFQTFSRIEQNSVAGRIILTLNEALFHKPLQFVGLTQCIVDSEGQKFNLLWVIPERYRLPAPTISGQNLCSNTVVFTW